MNARSLYEMVGGFETFERLVDEFYTRVETDPLLRPMYPQNLDTPRRHLALFLAQYFGGPPTYSELRGHPRLRMRHLPFAVTQAARDAWMSHMTAALNSLGLPEILTGEIQRYFADAATFLINSRD
jgi:hemoglobin